ncbi:MAG: HD domain-containing protein [Puniceicoccales bacterium]|jgi:3'-5' exoribonuclease|nr:HD domain-containing protein [Puniceicoccales bacterium]
MYDVIPAIDLKSAPNGSRFSTVAMIFGVECKISPKNNSEYLDVKVGDKTSNFSCKIFGSSPFYNFFKTAKQGAIIILEGIVKQFNGAFSPDISVAKELSAKEISDGNFEQFLIPCAEEGRTTLKAALDGAIGTIADETLRKTVVGVISELGDCFEIKPAGTMMHHAYKSGLLEHTVHAVRAGQALLPLYPFVDHDLAIAGLILHDVGKVVEYGDELVAQRTKAGILQGHLVIGYKIVRRVALQKKLSDDLLERLEHILLSHHDLPEFGTVVRPATPEAFFVALVDNLDAKMGMVEQLLKTTSPANVFSEKHFGLDSRILVEKILHE